MVVVGHLTRNAEHRDSRVNHTHLLKSDTIGKKSHKAKSAMNEAKWWHLWIYLFLLGLDSIITLLLLTPIVPRIKSAEGSDQNHYAFHQSLWDVAVLAIPRLLSALLTIALSYHRLNSPPLSPYDLYHENGDRKTKVELEEEALAEPLIFKLKRHVSRMPFVCEVFTMLTGALLAVKCLARLNVEIGIYDETQPRHALFWIAISCSALFSLLETSYLDFVERVAGDLGGRRRQQLAEMRQTQIDDDMSDVPITANWMERVSGSLAQPLLSRVNAEDQDSLDEENATSDKSYSTNGKNERTSRPNGIQSDSEYSATWSDLLAVCLPDMHLIICSTVFLFAAAIANVYVPKFTGEVLDALVAHQQNSTSGDGTHEHESIVHIPGFVKNIKLLLLVSILGGIFGGIRGAIFTMVGARVNVRLRIQLMDNLLSQDIGFFDTTRTGDITSRLSSDTTLVGSSITNNLNSFLRSVVQAIGVLIFMFFISWQLSILAFITVPTVSVLSKWYGRYIRKLTRLQQKKLAEGNSVSEASMSAMQTVRSFAAESVELDEFEQCMEHYLTLNKHAAVTALGYSVCVNSLPEIVKAVVLFYGGLLVQSDGHSHITGGQLVSFILYLSSLSQAFSTLGGVYASLIRAIGAADKVFELMNREPQYTKPSYSDPERIAQAVARKQKHLLKVDATKVVKQQASGLFPTSCTGEITFNDVTFCYPTRPQRLVLDRLDLHVPAGSIIALVGASGSGKSSIVKLINHLYEHSSGAVCIDGYDVRDLCPSFISKWVSVVPQEPTLMARSIKRNIMYGLEGTDFEPTQEEVEEAARLANAASFIEALPQGYDTEVGERGIRLSGGQKQRIAIARALCRRPRVLLLDEATSALDAESEYVVQEAIDGMINGQRSLDGDPSRSMTVVIVAHRLSTIKSADRIFVIKDGKVCEQGNHDSLIQNENGVYSSLVRRQMGTLSRVPSQQTLSVEEY